MYNSIIMVSDDIKCNIIWQYSWKLCWRSAGCTKHSLYFLTHVGLLLMPRVEWKPRLLVLSQVTVAGCVQPVCMIERSDLCVCRWNSTSCIGSPQLFVPVHPIRLFSCYNHCSCHSSGGHSHRVDYPQSQWLVTWSHCLYSMSNTWSLISVIDVVPLAVSFCFTLFLGIEV